MSAVQIALYVVASWLLAAHFLRADDQVLTGLCVATPLLFFVHRRWVLLTLQFLAYAASVVWLVTTWQILSMRRALGVPWGRSAIILLAVATVTALAGWLLRGASASNSYRAA